MEPEDSPTPVSHQEYSSHNGRGQGCQGQEMVVMEVVEWSLKDKSHICLVSGSVPRLTMCCSLNPSTYRV